MEFQSRGIKVEDEPGGKRRATAEEWTANKKRALSSMSDSPVAANGVADDSRKHGKPNDEEMHPQEEDEIEVCGTWIGGASAFAFRDMFVLELKTYPTPCSAFARQLSSGVCGIINETIIER